MTFFSEKSKKVRYFRSAHIQLRFTTFFRIMRPLSDLLMAYLPRMCTSTPSVSISSRWATSSSITINLYNFQVPTDSGICHTFNGVALSKILKPSTWFSDFRWYQPSLSRYLRAIFTQWCFQTCWWRGALGGFQVTGNWQRGGLRILNWYHAGVLKYWCQTPIPLYTWISILLLLFQALQITKQHLEFPQLQVWLTVHVIVLVSEIKSVPEISLPL